jgi:endoglucanase
MLVPAIAASTFGCRPRVGRINAELQQDGNRVCEVRDGAIIRGPKTAKHIAIVFTGHEFAEGGETILGELRKHQAKASFFLTGTFLANTNFSSLVARIRREGHLIGPHSDQHLLYCTWETPPRTLLQRWEFERDIVANLAKIDPGLVSQPCLRSSRAASIPRIYLLPPYEHSNREIADWTRGLGLVLINITPGTRSTADYTGESDKNFVSSQAILDSIVVRERAGPAGLNGFILLLHIGSGPGRADKFHTKFGELLDHLASKGYRFIALDELVPAE